MMAPLRKFTPQQEQEIRVLFATGTSRRSLAFQHAVSETTIDRAIGPRHGIMGPPRAKRGPCAICAKPPTDAKIMRLTLVFQDGTKRTSRGAGSIDLCEPCWQAKAAVRRRKPRV